MLFALPLAPQAVPAACALAAGICSPVTRVGVVHGTRIVESVDVLCAEGAAGAATAGMATRRAARLAPRTLDRLANEFHDVPNARGAVTMAHDLVRQAPFGPVRLHGRGSRRSSTIAWSTPSAASGRERASAPPRASPCAW